MADAPPATASLSDAVAGELCAAALRWVMVTHLRPITAVSARRPPISAAVWDTRGDSDRLTFVKHLTSAIL